MIEILRQSDLVKITHYPKAVVDTIRESVRILDEAYGADRARDGDGGLEFVVESQEELQALLQTLPFGDCPEFAEEIYPNFLRVLYIISNERTIEICLPKEWATKSMLEVIGK